MSGLPDLSFFITPICQGPLSNTVTVPVFKKHSIPGGNSLADIRSRLSTEYLDIYALSVLVKNPRK